MKIKAAIVGVVLLIIYFVLIQTNHKDEEALSKNSADTKNSLSSNEVKYPSANTSSKRKDDPLEGISDGHVAPPNRRFIQTTQKVRNDPENWFEEATTIATPGISEQISTNSIHSLLDRYALIIKDGGYPSGLNYEITNALLGDNAKKIALLSMAHPRINDQGELTDQWGTPYHFHLESRSDVTIRSAGEDLVMYTEDDIVSNRGAR